MLIQQLASAAERALALATVALVDRHAPDDGLAWLELHAGLSGLHLRDGQAGEELIRGRATWRTHEQREHLVKTGQLGDQLGPVGARACLLRRREVMKARADLKRVWDPR